MAEPKTLIYDIETSLELVSVFGLKYNDFIPPENIVLERHLISVCWKWLGESKIHQVSILDDPKRFARDPHDDRYVCEVFHKILSEADCLVAHNGDSFDYKYLQTRFLVHGLPPTPPVTSIDTYKIAKQRFLLNSNKLDYIGKLLGFGGKKPTPKGLWLDVLKGDKKAIKIMVDYNRRDVDLLDKVFKKFIPYIPNFISRELFGGTGCPRCGSNKVQSRGLYHAITRTYRRFQCNTCHGWYRLLKSEIGSTTQHRVL